MQRPLLLSIAASLLTLASVADAEPGQQIALRLEYEAPDKESCPTAESFALMLAGEFGYLVVRPDVAPLLRVQVRRKGKSLEAETWAPHPNGVDEQWHGITEDRVSCRELVYDLAYTVRLHLGPSAWAKGEVPPHLAAPPEITVGSVQIWPFDRRRLEPQPPLRPRPQPFLILDPGLGDAPRPQVNFTLTVSFSAMMMPYGLSKFALGGGLNVDLRWRWYGIAAEMRGFMTPATGIGEPPIEGRTNVATAALIPCGFIYFFDACAVASVSDLGFSFPSTFQLGDVQGVTFGLGARGQARMGLTSQVGLFGFGEVTRELSSVILRSASDQTGRLPFEWRSPNWRVLFGLGVNLKIF